ncbi:hypothetical protein TNCV_1653141 [Trichonephila clavipes]|nr:hypothetical protein TNCV_1653141 [Trichonephila clavipes]
MVQSSHCMMWGCQVRCRPQHLTMVQNYEVSISLVLPYSATLIKTHSLTQNAQVFKWLSFSSKKCYKLQSNKLNPNALIRIKIMNRRRRFFLGIWTVKQSSIPYRESVMLSMARVVFSILLSGMTAIGRTRESGRRGYGASSGRKSLRAESFEAA